MNEEQSDDALIIVAPNGARLTKEDHPNTPIDPDEMADEVSACVAAGAAMVHLHARDANGEHSLNIGDNQRMLTAVRERIGGQAIIQLTTEAVGRYQPAEQMVLIRELQPEAASFALRELVADASKEDEAASFFHWCHQRNIIAQYILYSPEDVSRYFSLRDRGIIPNGRHHLLLVLGRYNTQLQASPIDLLPMLSKRLQQDPIPWAVCAFGQLEHRCLGAGLAFGGDVRVGFENNIYTNKGTIAKSNAEQVESIAAITQSLGRSLCSVDDARHRLLSL